MSNPEMTELSQDQAAALAASPEDCIRSLMDSDLVLAGRCAARVDVLPALGHGLLDLLRTALVDRSRHAGIDLKERIACGLVVGELGDPRLEEREGPEGRYLIPSMIEISEGHYPIGDDQTISWGFDENGARKAADGEFTAHRPRHTVFVKRFQIGQYPVTNGEWACFMEAGGYRDERHWDTDDARRWLRGKISPEEMQDAYESNLQFRLRLLANPGLLDQLAEEDVLPNRSSKSRWEDWIRLDEHDFRLAIEEFLVENALRREPKGWGDERYDRASQPVVAITWYEARAYCEWLSAQSESTFRLPTEVEYEAAAAGPDGREFSWGSEDGALRTNTIESEVMRQTPIGVFPAADTPEEVSDLSGNVMAWTSTVFGVQEGLLAAERAFAYPYDANDGREDPVAPRTMGRVIRGGSWRMIRPTARAQHREGLPPRSCLPSLGLRLVCES